MRQRAVRASGRDGVERQVAERTVRVAKRAQLRCGAQFVEAALRRDLFHPFQEARHRDAVADMRSEEHTSELQSLMRISYAVFCLKKKITYRPTNKNLSPILHKD